MSKTGPNVTLVRHGETTWSMNGQHTGRTDLELTEFGERQAKRVGSLIGPKPFDLVLVSPRRRTRRTAELAGLTPYEIDDDLQEWDYGEFEGMTTYEIQTENPGWSIWNGPWVGGETVEEVEARADRVIARVRRQPPGSRVALVAHGHFLRVLGARWVGQPAAGGQWLGLDTAAVCHLSWEHDYPIVHRWNF
ncbi:MAG: histidine phosphatase family protein, partial [Acidimicrobiaceae bacterium]|nr:histidine phosphatase family protein [Acidimicrobiaceae bacterium]